MTASRLRLRCSTQGAIPGQSGIAIATPLGAGDARNRTEDEHHVRNHRGPPRPGTQATAELTRASPWHAALALGFAHRRGGTLLEHRAHTGPLRVQKPLFPEGPAVCHAVVLHPPGGVAGGDALAVDVRAAAGAHALLTTPGAGKWYRANERRASQRVTIGVSSGAVVEWLPQPSIFFDGVDASIETRVSLAEDALYIGWEALCFGRTASQERFTHGRVALRTVIERDARLLWHERAIVDGGSGWLVARAGLGRHPVCATLVAAGRTIARHIVDACRAAPLPAGVDAGITTLPDVLIARCLAPDTERATMWFGALWRVLRPALAGRAATPLRIWNT